MVKHLAAVFRAECAWVGELRGTPPDRTHAIAVFRSSGDIESFEQKLSGTGAGQVISEGQFCCAKDAQRLFPLDELAASVEAES